VHWDSTESNLAKMSQVNYSCDTMNSVNSVSLFFFFLSKFPDSIVLADILT